jgi:hypothetical protein
MEQVKQSHEDFYGENIGSKNTVTGKADANMTSELIAQKFQEISGQSERIRKQREDKGDYVMLSD